MQIVYTKKLMSSKGYLDYFFYNKLRIFLSKYQNKTKKANDPNKFRERIRANIPYDEVTNLHLFIKKVTKDAARKAGIGQAVIVPKNKLVDMIKPKKKIIAEMSSYMGFNRVNSKKRKKCPTDCTLCMKNVTE